VNHVAAHGVGAALSASLSGLVVVRAGYSDRELSDEDRQRIKAAILTCDGVCGAHDLRTRFSGDRTFIEYHVEVDGRFPVERGHAIGDATERAVENLLSGTVEAMAHLRAIRHR
jgi:divalent metal cation (Fe/Co/Zn/Cd) transporter